MEKYIPITISAAVLIYGGVVDFKRREIPEVVPIVLLFKILFGFFSISSILGLAVPAALLFVASKITNSEIPGGDFKLLCSLGFTCGLQELAAILFIAGIGAVFYGFVKRLPIKRHIPLCSYVALAYLTLHVIALALEGGGIM